MLYKTSLLKSISYLSFSVKNFLTKSYFPKFCKEHILVTEVLWHKFASCSGFSERCVAFIDQQLELLVMTVRLPTLGIYWLLNCACASPSLLRFT